MQPLVNSILLIIKLQIKISIVRFYKTLHEKYDIIKLSRFHVHTHTHVV